MKIPRGAESGVFPLDKQGLCDGVGFLWVDLCEPRKPEMRPRRWLGKSSRLYRVEKICGPSHEELKQATSNAVELLALSGRIIPYPVGPLGVIAEGTYADILLVDCNPVEDAMIMTGYKNDFDLIMKDGVIYKNTLDRVSHGVTENRRTAQRFSKPQEENK